MAIRDTGCAGVSGCRHACTAARAMTAVTTATHRSLIRASRADSLCLNVMASPRSGTGPYSGDDEVIDVELLSLQGGPGAERQRHRVQPQERAAAEAEAAPRAPLHPIHP